MNEQDYFFITSDVSADISCFVLFHHLPDGRLEEVDSWFDESPNE